MPKLSVVVSQGQSANPAKRGLEEEIVTALLFEKGIRLRADYRPFLLPSAA